MEGKAKLRPYPPIQPGSFFLAVSNRDLINPCLITIKETMIPANGRITFQ